MELFAQVIGIIAAAVSVAAFQFRSNRGVFICQMISAFLFAVNMFMLGAWAGCLLNLLAAVRGVLLSLPGKKGINRYTLAFVLLATVGCYTWQYAAGLMEYVWLDILLAAQFMVGTLLCWHQDGRLLRLGQMLVMSPVCLLYNGIFHAVGGVITECVNILSVAASLVRYGWNGFENRDEKEGDPRV